MAIRQITVWIRNGDGWEILYRGPEKIKVELDPSDEEGSQIDSYIFDPNWNQRSGKFVMTATCANLEADGMITIYDLNTSEVVAQYEGLEVHKAMRMWKENNVNVE